MAPSNSTTTSLPNPYTLMAFIPPEMETKIMVQTYTAVGSLAVFLWDIILHLPQDYKLATQYRINFSFVLYCIARLTSLAYVFGLTVMLTTPLNCDLLRKISILYPFTTPLITVHFVMRVCALYGNNKYVVAFFSMTWLFVLGGSIMVPIATLSVKAPTMKHCSDSKTELAKLLATFSVIIHDNLIFIATSWALMRNSYFDVSMKGGIRVMVLGRGLPAFSKSILRNGQGYYLATIILGIVFTVFLLMPQLSIPASTIGIPCFVVLNNMSSYVYRNVRFGFYQDYTIATSMIDRAFQPSQSPHSQHVIVLEQSISTKLEDRKDLEAE